MVVDISVGDFENYSYNNKDQLSLAKSMYELLKNKLEELGFIIIKEEGEMIIKIFISVKEKLL